MGHIAAMPFLAPVLYLQGKHVIQRALKLPEASGNRTGVAGEGPLIQLLILGDSSAAGVGVSTQSEALAGRLVENLSQFASIEWKVIAKTGATTASTIRYLRNEPCSDYHHVVSCLGVNDVTSNVGVRNWIKSQRELRSMLRDRFQARHLVVNGLPPLRHFPLLPQPLRWYLGCRALRFSRLLKLDLKHEPDCSYQDLEFSPDVDLMAIDGFHPGPEIYQEWADQVAEKILLEEKSQMTVPSSM